MSSNRRTNARTSVASRSSRRFRNVLRLEGSQPERRRLAKGAQRGTATFGPYRDELELGTARKQAARGRHRLQLHWPALALVFATACGEMAPDPDPPQPVVGGRPVETICAGGETGPRSYFFDQDGDSFGAGDSIGATCALTPPPGTTFVDGDCNDDDGAHWDVGPLYYDGDGDGVGYYTEDRLEGCVFPTAGYALEAGDCDDTDATKQERSFRDLDGDGWGSDEICVARAEPESDVVRVWANGDCNDADGSINPGAVDVAGDLIDADCDGWGFPTEQEACELRDLDTGEPARVGEDAYWYCVPLELTLPSDLRPECALLPDPIIMATRRVEMAPGGVMYDIKVGNTGGILASIVVRQIDEDGHVEDSAPVQVAPLGLSDWLQIWLTSNIGGPNYTRVELLNADGTTDCSLVDSSGEFVLFRPRHVP